MVKMMQVKRLLGRDRDRDRADVHVIVNVIDREREHVCWVWLNYVSAIVFFLCD